MPPKSGAAGDIPDAGSSAIPFSAAHQTFGDIRLTAKADGTLVTEPRLGDHTPLELASSQHGVILDMPVLADVSATQVNDAG